MRSPRATIKRRSTAMPTRATVASRATSSTPPPPAPARGLSALPYGAYPDVLDTTSRLHHAALARRRHGNRSRVGQLCHRLLRGLGLQTSQVHAAAPLRPGDVLRDFPYFTQASEISFFSTHPLLCDAIFTVGHGERLRFGAGLWAGQEATVLGARAGQLWLVLDGESIARQLPAPEAGEASRRSSLPDVSASNGAQRDSHRHRASEKAAGDFWARVEAYYQVQRLGDVSSSGGEHHTHAKSAVAADARTASESAETPASAPVRVLESGLSPHVLGRVDEATRRVYSAEQRAFLQRAPDLFVSIVSEAHAAYGDVHSLSPFLTHDTESSQSPFHGTPLRLSGASEGGSGGSPVSDGSPFAASSSRGEEKDGATEALRAALPLVVPGAGQASSLYAMAAQSGGEMEGKVVLLAPRVLAVSGTVGWAGEGPLVTEAGGIQHFKASLSASLVFS